MSNPYLLAGILLSIIFAFAFGLKVGADREEARQAREDALVSKVAEAAQRSAAQAIASIEIKHTTIQSRTQVITRDVPVYRECRNTTEMQELLNNARSDSSAVGLGSRNP